jgi:hypothetical protein
MKVWVIFGLMCLLVVMPRNGVWSQPPGGDPGEVDPFGEEDDSGSSTTGGSTGGTTGAPPSGPISCLMYSGKNSCHAHLGNPPQSTAPCSASTACGNTTFASCGSAIMNNPRWNENTGEGLTYAQGQQGKNVSTRSVNCTVNASCRCALDDETLKYYCKISSWIPLSSYTAVKKEHSGICTMN